MGKYDDIIDLPHWVPKMHRRMSACERAAQFAPFAALTGYDEMVNETSQKQNTSYDKVYEDEEF